MPPPRRPLPLRPWRPPRTSAYARWVSDGPRDPKRARPDDSAPGGGEAAQSAATEVNAHASRRLHSPHSAPAASWPGGLASRASTLPSPSTAPAASEPPGQHPPGTTCLVCNQSFHTTSALRHHITIADHVASWPVAFSTQEEATRRRELWSQFNAAGWRSPYIRARRKGQTHSCNNCSTPFASLDACVEHLLSNEQCTKSRTGIASEYACCQCFKILETTEHVRQHVQSSPGCELHHIKIRDAKPRLPVLAEDHFHSYVHLLVHIYSDLKRLTFPVVVPILHSVLRYLNSAYYEAKQTQDSRVLQTLGPSYQIHEEVRWSHVVQKPTRQWAEQRALRLAQKGYQASIRALLGIYRDLQAFDSMPASLMTQRIVRYLRPIYREAANQRDQLSIRHSIENYPEVYRKVQQKGEVGHETTKEDHAPTRATGQIRSEKNPPKTIPPVSKEERPVSTTEPQDEVEDLKIELQRLREQVKLLQGNIVGQGIQDTDTKISNATKDPPLTMTDSTQSVKPETLRRSAIAFNASATIKPVSKEDVEFNEITKPPSTTPSPKLQKPSISLASSSESLDMTAHPPAGTMPSTPTLNRRYEPKLQAQLEKEKLKVLLTEGVLSKDTETASPLAHAHLFSQQTNKFKTDGQRLVRQIHDQAASKSSSRKEAMAEARHGLPNEPPVETSKPKPPATPDTTGSSESSNRSLLDELFPEASNYIQPHYTERNPYPKLSLPDAVPLISTYSPKEKLSKREQYMQAFQRSTEKLTALQLLHCSTELTESDFRRIVPGGRHIEGWSRDGDIHKIIPGRDPLSLERLPFYYLVFKNPDAALRYKSNATRLHQLSRLHGPTSVMSALPPTAGVLEDGEDIKAALSSYLLTPAHQPLQLNMVMQPYNAALSRLLEQGGYKPIVPAITPAGKPIYKVLLHIEGYESSPYDVYQLFMQDASKRGLSWPFLQEHQSIRRLRDIIDIKTRFQAVSTANPRAARSERPKHSHDPYAAFLSDKEDRSDAVTDEQDAKVINQIIMNKVYNRWIIEFNEEEGAKRFARLWHRKVLPIQASVKHRTWRDLEEVRMCNAEYLW